MLLCAEGAVQICLKGLRRYGLSQPPFKAQGVEIVADLIAVFLALIWRQSSLLKVREFPVLNLGNLPRKRAEFWGISVLSISADEA
jgi:hypothetical protein